MTKAKEVGLRLPSADIVAMLEAQMKMQQEFTEFKKKSVEEVINRRKEKEIPESIGSV